MGQLASASTPISDKELALRLIESIFCNTTVEEWKHDKNHPVYIEYFKILDNLDKFNQMQQMHNTPEHAADKIYSVAIGLDNLSSRFTKMEKRTKRTTTIISICVVLCLVLSVTAMLLR